MFRSVKPSKPKTVAFNRFVLCRPVFLFLFNAEDYSFCLSFWEGGVKTLENNFFVGKFSVRKTPLFMRLVSEKETKREHVFVLLNSFSRLKKISWQFFQVDI